jgi:hypothetical protein
LADIREFDALKNCRQSKKILQLFFADSSVFKNLEKSASGYVPAMIRNCDSSLRLWVGKDVMASCNSL